MVTFFLLRVFIWFDNVPRNVVKWVIVCILYIVKLGILLCVRPHDLAPTNQTLIILAIQLRFIRFQAPEYNCVIITARSYETRVIFEPKNGAYWAFMAFKDTIFNSKVLPERKNLNVVLLVVARIHVPTVRKLYLSTSAHIMVLEFGFCHFVLLQSVYHHSIKMPDNDEKARGVNCNGLDNIIEALDNLEVQIARVSRIVPDH